MSNFKTLLFKLLFYDFINLSSFPLHFPKNVEELINGENLSENVSLKTHYCTETQQEIGENY